MILKDSFPVYAQYGEDITLLSILFDVDGGFYVDIGANYPTVDSVTKLFYDKGWRGINIEPIPSLYRQLKKARRYDINLPIGIGDRSKQLVFYENQKIPGHSSFSRKEAAQHDDSSIIEYKVEVRTLEEVLTNYGVETIHFLKIDVEGFEEEVIKGNDWEKYRPFVVCVESNHRTTTWQDTLVKNRYKLFINDGLNEYYIAEEQWSRTDGFAERAVSLSYRALKQHQYESWRYDSRLIKELTRLNQQHYEMVEVLREENKLSLARKSYKDRVVLSLKALTIDWIRSRK